MSLGSALITGFTGVRAAQQALDVTAHNVANVNTPGYTRKALEQEALVLGGRGAGVEAADVNRDTDQFLLAEARRQASIGGRSEVISRFHNRIQDFFGAPGGDGDVAVQIGALGAALDGFANVPGSSAKALEVVNLADQLSLSVGALADGAQQLRGDADREIALTVAEINTDLETIAELNQEITRLQAIGQDHTELLDRRDLTLQRLAEKIDVSSFLRDNGELVVQGAGGQALVDHEAQVLVYEPAAEVYAGTVFGPIKVFSPNQIDPATGKPKDPNAGTVLVSGGVRAELTPELQADGVPDADQQITSSIGGGRLAGLLESRDRFLPAFDDQLQELAGTLRFALNAAHNDGLAQAPPDALSGSRTDLSGFAAATRSGNATIAVIDTTDGSTATAFQIDLAAAADENDLVAQINAGLGALGSAAVGADGNLELTLASSAHGFAIAEGDSAVELTDAAGRTRSYGFSHYFGLNDLLVQTGARDSDMRVRADLSATPSLLSTRQLDVTAGPPLAATAGGAGDNRAAQALGDALRTGYDVVARGGLPAKTTTPGAYASDLIAHQAVAAQRAEETAARDSDLAQALEFRAASVSGVNLDEEMTRLILFQRAYSVSARVVSITNQLFDELLRTAG